MRAAWLLFAACSFHPLQDTSDGSMQPGSDGPAPSPDAADAPAATADAQQCFGTGLVHVCLDAPPNAPLTLTGPFDTGGSGCTKVAPQADASELCVLAGTTATVTGTFTATGTRALVVIGAQSVTV